MKISDCTSDICRMMVEHAERQELMAWLVAVMGALAILALIIRWWRGAPPPI